ncbi:MAG: hypothetical protein EHM19_00475 [Candidatus Latescibacterota bacterium]|nr:MAG: hypothetical protein EHM19_00475 [Candidatus Latescibacterota bacterium]
MTKKPKGEDRIVEALDLLDEAAVHQAPHLASLLKHKYAALKVVIMSSGNGATHAFEPGELRAAEAAGGARSPDLEMAMVAYEHVRRN